MIARFSPLVAIVGMVAYAGAANAHYHILLPDKPSAQADEAVVVSLRYGHPFEQQMFPTQKPRRAIVVAPDGNVIDMNAKMTRIDTPVPNAEAMPSYQWKFTPTQRGDYVFAVLCDPVWMADEGAYFEDSVKVTIHVQAQRNWDAVTRAPFELVPLTRPYGLRAGMVFQAVALGDGNRGQPGTLVEVERLNPTPPKELPPDEHITRTLKTDPAGVATVTLTEGGWWALTAIRDGGTRERAGRTVPVRQRTTLWVKLDETVPLAPAK